MNEDYKILDVTGSLEIEDGKAVYRNNSGKPQEIKGSVTFTRRW